MSASMPYPLLDDANNECGPAEADHFPHNQCVPALGLHDDQATFVLKPGFRRSNVGIQTNSEPVSESPTARFLKCWGSEIGV